MDAIILERRDIMKDPGPHDGIVEAPVETGRIKRVYDILSRFYPLAAPFENRIRMRGIETARIRPGERVLEVAVGAGYSFVEILKRVGPGETVYGIDISARMVEKTGKRAERSGFTNFDLRVCDARVLPFPDDFFDVLYNSYMLDLLPIKDFSVVLGEFRRVLKKSGRAVLVNLSKKGREPVFLEKIYRLNPYLLGGCRPVLMEEFVREAGFRAIKRDQVKNVLISEIITAVKGD